MLYLDDSQEKLRRRTSHPVFNDLCMDNYYLNSYEEFSPFGNDTGRENLKELEYYYKTTKETEIFLLDFISEYFGRWTLN